jgi:quinol monooxygenase YgiN
MPITVLASIQAQAGAAESVQRALHAMILPSRAEAGCLRYEVFASQTTPGIFRLLESYADDAALAAHHESQHFSVLLDTIRNSLATPIQIERLDSVAL